MLKRATNCSFSSTRKPFTRKRQVISHLNIGKRSVLIGIMPTEEWAKLKSVQDEPAFLAKDGIRNYWYFNGQFWWDDDNLAVDDVKALLISRDLTLKRKLDRARSIAARSADDSIAKRERIPDNVKQFVFERDKGQCVACSSRENLQFDHIIPVVLGGSTEPANLQILCAACNAQKGPGITIG